MTSNNERYLIYTALLLICMLISALLGIEAGVWTLIQMTAAIELMYWLGAPYGDNPSRRSM